MSDINEDPRREFLIRALGMGLFASSVTSGLLQPVYAMGDIPAKLPPGRSIYKLKGSVTVDGTDANLKTQIGANSLVKTGRSSRVIFVVGSDAFILRSNSELQLGGDGFLIQGMRMLTGKLLSVFGKRAVPHKIQTVTATIGIRGTGIYVESDEEKSYVCTCYGHTLVASVDDPSIQQEVVSKHHDKPLYIMRANAGMIIQPAPFIDHTDV
ncbi:MAG: hypothetical protein KAU21_17865, partial [Gammaproteobacteria bacterium]|nr:hypothetical protein [Gammaproteobacteria bacterium]